MITIDWVELIAICICFILLGVLIGTKTSADRWIEHEEYKAWKENRLNWWQR